MEVLLGKIFSLLKSDTWVEKKVLFLLLDVATTCNIRTEAAFLWQLGMSAWEQTNEPSGESRKMERTWVLDDISELF